MSEESWGEVKSPWFKFTEEGDNIIGTLISVREAPSRQEGHEGEMVPIYEMKCDSGEYHELDDEKKVIKTAIKIAEGEIYNVGGHWMLDKQMRNIKLGSKIKIEHAGTKKAQKSGNHPMKIRKVYTNGVMDTEFLEELENSKNDDF